MKNKENTKVKVYACEIRDANDTKVAVRYFETREEAGDEQSELLNYTWFGYLAAPIVTAYEVTPEAAAELLR